MDLGLDLIEGKSTDEYALLGARGLAAAAALAGRVGGFNNLLDCPLPLVLEQGDRFVGTGVHTVGAPVAAFVDDLRYVGFKFNAVSGEDAGCSGGCRLRLENGFLDGLGRMRQP